MGRRVRSQTADRLALAAVIAAVLGFALLLLIPGSVTEVRTVMGTELTTERRSRSLLEVVGLRLIPLLLVPIAFAAGGLWRRKDVRVIAAAFLWLFVLAGALSIGLFFAPSAVLLTIAAVRTPRGSPDF